ncbi:anamorsin homolog, partial [Anneissia japonica]|uniref:anamorsin homolog n=1 Tax=Anneissia japonica TaxID=1529436 RepID=UPI0014256B4E
YVIITVIRYTVVVVVFERFTKMENITFSGKCVLVLWATGQDPENVKTLVDKLNISVGEGGSVKVENMQRLLLSSYSSSMFDVALLGTSSPHVSHSLEILGEVLRILKPDGTMVIKEPAETGNSNNTQKASALIGSLKLSGYVNLSEASVTKNGSQPVVEITCKKPAFEMGSSVSLPLSFAKKSQGVKTVDTNVAKVWSLSTNDIMDDDLDLIDSDDLLQKDDLIRPTAESLKAPACGPSSGRKKACKNCTCGLAEDLDAESEGRTPQPRAATSACGSCYLGDAFRCASCPYLGMPAFKPGEKISLSARQLNADA